MTTRQIHVGNTTIGGDSCVSIQSMCNTKTDKVEETVAQILSLESLGCDIVRVTANTTEAATAIKNIVKQIHIPLVADIHFDYKLALLSAENGASKIRINPGNIGGVEKVKYVADFLKERKIPIRIGVNEGSLDKSLSHLPRVDALVQSALDNVSALENVGFYDIVVSIKSSSVKNTVEANKKFSAVCDCPLHIGVTEAGTYKRGIIKNSVGIGALLLDGIGDTVRVSLADKPEEEVIAAKMLLKSLELKKGVEIIACPTCGRTNIDVIEFADKLERLTANINKNIKIAVMGCIVNGVGESGDADFGVAGGKERSAIFKDGNVIKTVDNCNILCELEGLLKEFTDEKI